MRVLRDANCRRTRVARLRRASSERFLRRSLAVDHVLRGAPAVPLRRTTRGVVVWAHIPFEDTDEWKLRPALVAAVEGMTLRLHPISGALSRLGRPGYLEILDLDAVGLERPCAVNLARLVEVERIDTLSVSGTLSVQDTLRFEVAAGLQPFASLPVRP
ncbi:MAG: hypothetical protein MUF83_06105 [Acidimicrobiales bacterium]|jgi:hypothetical protein|nr:hypothetical protein [Acidimicrobiales bacterium]